MKFYAIILLSFASCYAPMDTEFLKAQTALDNLKNSTSAQEKFQLFAALSSLMVRICQKRQIDIQKLKFDPSYKLDRTLDPEEHKLFMKIFNSYKENIADIEDLLRKSEDLNFKSNTFKKKANVNDNSWSAWAYGYYNYYSGYCTLV